MELQQYEKEHLEQLRRLLPECTVLLKSGGDFPLEQTGKLALYGSGARHTVKGGTGSGEVNSRYFVNAEQGLTDAGFTVTTQEWLDAYDQIRIDAKRQFIKEIKTRARKKHTNAIVEGMGAIMPEPEYSLPLNGDGDVALYILSRISGEGNDRSYIPGDILLTETEQRDILALHKKYQKFMLVLNVGGPVDLTPVLEVENILVLSQLGVDTGTVLADLILGKAYPSGKLTATWASKESYPRIGDFGGMEDTRYREGIYVGYRYFDTVGTKPLFPFGFGLSYTDFTVSDAHVIAEGERVCVSAVVKNVGQHLGKETLQLYVSVPEGRLDQPFQTLAAFAKTGELAAGEAQEINVDFQLSDMASFDTENAAYILEKGDYVLRLGTNSTETIVCGIVKLDADVTVRKVRHIGGEPDFVDWKPVDNREIVLPAQVPVVTVSAADIRTETVTYDTPQEIAPEIKALSDEELAYINVGAFDPKAGVLSIIGNAGKNVAGAAGETTGELKNKGIPPLVMADGPAGLRLSKDYIVDNKGVHALGETLPETVLDFMPAPVVFLSRLMGSKVKKDAEILHQYATAIPIGTAVAQSWNRELAYICGDIVGDEMERFGVHLWLAPALNIHRDIRCGRNFEYFSEDPLLSGIFAAEIIKGVQKHPGCGTTIKHYAANNQETNRYVNNSIVSERALREIYLRGFGICMREAEPHAVMTSYNLLNGMHTSERRDLTEDYLRSECGHQGLVMTDWLVAGAFLSGKSKYPAPKASGIATAGGDLVMPGGNGDYKDILAALKTGKLSRAQLEINATRVLQVTKLLKG
ncbi:MAG: glycoside hydrolase family 3 C-terminal domain-containing protein [Lachnospiraceae bacterium]|nr:glycoside hydrolase family 3 C-terminal domain-containing protein [Lachnospiraceae bacterium]